MLQNAGFVVTMLALAACARTPERPDPASVFVSDSAHDAAAKVTADSILALDPVVEVAAAIARSDHRPVGVCGFACLPPGVGVAERTALGTDSMIVVPGTGDAISGPNMARLNAVADAYATAYNRLLVEHLKKQPPSSAE